MIIRALVLGAFFILGSHCYYGDLQNSRDNPFSHSIWDWKFPDLYESETRHGYIEGREFDESKESDREALAPDYKDPVRPKDELPKPAPQPNRPPYTPSVLPGGVIDIDAGDFGISDGFPRFPDTFGFASTIGRNPGSIFGIGNFFGPISEPWWKGENVCIEREETTDDEDSDVSSKQNDTDTQKTPNFFSTSISLSNCRESQAKYECVTKINNHGIVKTFVVRYKCCYGYKRMEGSSGCSKKLELQPLLTTIEDVGGKQLRNMIQSSALDDKFSSENLTVFVPTDQAMTEFVDKMVELNQVDLNVAAQRRRRQIGNPVSTKDLVLNHAVSGFIDISELENEEVLYSENNNNSVRFNTYPTRNYGKMLTVNCIRVQKGDNLASNGVVHVIDGVLNPVGQSILDTIKDHPLLSSLSEVLQNTDLEKNFKPDGHYTVFAPTNEAFDKLDESTKQKLLRGDACAATIAKHHIVAHTVCSCAIIGNATTHSVDGELLNLHRTDDDALYFERTAKMVKTDIMTTNGVIHLIDTIVVPDTALYVHQALKNENFTKFLDILDQAGLSEEIDSMKNVTFFAPSDQAFDDPETVKLLDELKEDKEKLKELVMYHTVEGQLESCDMNNNILLKTKKGDQSLRLNLYSTLPVFTNIINRATVNCARITGYDEKSCGSVIHEVNKILLPPSKSLLDEINSNENYKTFSELIKNTDLEAILKDNTQSLTVLVPSDEAFRKMDAKELEKLKEDKNKANTILKNHVLTEVLCCSGVGPHTWGFNTLIPTLAHQHQSVGRIDDSIRIGGATVTKCDNIATNGVVHMINKVLIPQQPRIPGFGFFLFDF